MPYSCGRRDNFYLWRVTANILNKQPWTNSKGWSSSLGVRHGANNTSPKKKRILRKQYKSHRLGWILWINNLSDVIWT
jgi:hypothetical protein